MVFGPIVVTLFELTLVYVHADGVECMHLALYEVSPCKTNGILLAENSLHFLDLLCEFRQG